MNMWRDVVLYSLCCLLLWLWFYTLVFTKLFLVALVMVEVLDQSLWEGQILDAPQSVDSNFLADLQPAQLHQWTWLRWKTMATDMVILYVTLVYRKYIACAQVIPKKWLFGQCRVCMHDIPLITSVTPSSQGHNFVLNIRGVFRVNGFRVWHPGGGGGGAFCPRKKKEKRNSCEMVISG